MDEDDLPVGNRLCSRNIGTRTGDIILAKRDIIHADEALLEQIPKLFWSLNEQNLDCAPSMSVSLVVLRHRHPYWRPLC